MILRKRNAWIFAFAFFLGFLALFWQFKQRERYRDSGRLGDGKTVESYGFDLSNARVPVATIVPSGVPREGLRSLDLPDFLDADGLDSLNTAGRSAFLYGRDRVIGVALNGAARAYPISVLNWHEVVNDTLGGRAVLITWNPLCGAACVYDRGSAEFGVSGLFHNSNLLVFERGAEKPSLWSQLSGRALTGPAAARGDSLARLPAALTRWDDWSARHPGSLVLAPDPVWLKQKYGRRPYVSYEGSDRLQYPVQPLPATGDGLRPLKTPMLSVWAGGERRLYPLPLIAARADASGFWRTEQADVGLEFRIWRGDPAVATVLRRDGEPLIAAQAYWFAWFSQEPAATDWLVP